MRSFWTKKMSQLKYIETLIVKNYTNLFVWIIGKDIDLKYQDAGMLFGVSVSKGNMQVMETLLKIHPRLRIAPLNFVETAIRNDRLDLLIWLADRGFSIKSEDLMLTNDFRLEKIGMWIVKFWSNNPEKAPPGFPDIIAQHKVIRNSMYGLQTFARTIKKKKKSIQI